MKTINELFFRNILKVLTATVVICSFLYILKPFIVALLFGGIFALAFSPFLSLIMKKYKWGRQKSLIIMILGAFFLAGVPFIIFFLRGSKLISGFFTKQSYIELSQAAQDKIYKLLDRVADSNSIDTSVVREKFADILNSLSGFVFRTFSDFLTSIPDLILTGIVMFLTFYFFLLKEEYIRSIFDKYFYLKKEHGNLFIKRLKTSSREVFFSNVVTGVIQSSIVALGALFCDIGDFYIIFVITFVFSFIPVIGAAPMAFFLGLIAFIDHRIGAGITMCVIGFISGVADNIIRPYLTSRGEIEVPGYIGFLAVIGGVIMLGLPGLFIGPLLASLMFGIIPIIIEEYFPASPHEEIKQEECVIKE